MRETQIISGIVETRIEKQGYEMRLQLLECIEMPQRILGMSQRKQVFSYFFHFTFGSKSLLSSSWKHLKTA